MGFGNTKNEKKKTWLMIFILAGVPEFFAMNIICSWASNQTADPHL